MVRTTSDIEDAAERARAWLDSIDPAITPTNDVMPLRRIHRSFTAVASAQREVDDAVAAAREARFSWATIGSAPGISRQAHSRATATLPRPEILWT
jgi:hypothetical protein